VRVMSKNRSKEMSSLKPLTEEQKPEGKFIDFIMGIFSRSPEAITLLEMFRMTREIYSIQKETSKQQVRLRYCLYSILSIMIIMSAILVGVFYSLNMTSIGLSFLGPLITGILGLVVVLVSDRKS